MSRYYALAFSDDMLGSHAAAVFPEYTPCRILVVEDNKSDVLLIKHTLRDLAPIPNATIFSDVPRVVDALALLDLVDYRLILLDLTLHDSAGTATVAALHAAAPHIPIVVYSGAHDPRLKEEALLCGARHFLVKGEGGLSIMRAAVIQQLGYHHTYRGNL